MEWQIYSSAHSLDAMDINSAMVILESGMLAFPIPDVNPPTAKRLSNVLAAIGYWMFCMRFNRRHL